jgi:outer membrane receptor protein involved in Fe transport
VYAPDAAKLYAPLSPGAFAGLVDRSTGKSRSWTQTLSLSVNGTLADLPGGELALAGVLEAGSQGYRDTPDARIDQGVFWGASSAEPAGGTRRNQAVGVEVSAPVLASLTLSGAARYDRFGFAGHSIGKATYNVGLEYRPLDSLLLRGSYATSFRAPDMNYIYATRTLGYYPEQTDDYQCRLAGQAYGSCDKRYDMDYSQGGNARLKPETARSFTYGLVWSPGHGVDLSLDYYRITISDEVTNLSVDQLLRTEADCRVGMTQGGVAVDPSSAQCRDAYARIARNPGNAPVNPNQVTAVQVNPINAASERTSGIDASANLRWDGGRAGRFGLNLAYTAVLDHRYRQFAGDAAQDLLSLSYQSEWRSRANATLDWSRGDWTATLAGTRYGRFPTNDYQGYRGPYVLFNGSVGYQLDRRTRLSLAVNNLANRMPVDHTAGWPGYPSSVYDIYGRQWWLQVDYHFGGKR